MRRVLAQLLIVWLVAMGPAHAGDKGVKSPPAPPETEDMEIIALMEILKMMDLAKEMEMAKEMEQLVKDKEYDSNAD